MFQEIKHRDAEKLNVKIYVYRTDLVHAGISGNKFYKLKYNIEEMFRKGFDTLLTFGGAYSNHIYATASAGQLFNFRTIGVIRGEEHNELNQTLRHAVNCGMYLYYVNRQTYREKNWERWHTYFKEKFGDVYILPEGGTNDLALKGAMHIFDEINAFCPIGLNTFICCPVGTGGTIAGIIKAAKGRGQIIGFPALKGGRFLEKEIIELIQYPNGHAIENFRLETSFHFGGYAKANVELVRFINEFKKDFAVPLDPVYNGKMLFGIIEMIKKGKIPEGSTIVTVHTGGLQGIQGFNERYVNLPDIK